MNQWGEETEYDRARVKSQRRNARMAKYRVVKAPLPDEEMNEKLEQYQRKSPEDA